LHGLQLWHALPEADEEVEPAFYHYPAQDMPRFEHNGVDMRLMMGEAYGLRSPVKTFVQTLYLEAHMTAGQSLILPDSEEIAVYVASGKILIDGEPLEQYSMAILEHWESSSITAAEDTRLAIIGGAAMPERFIEWNFVSSRKERIALAKRDWAAGQFPLVVGDEEEFIPLPGE
jgi:redox-sensitive bicupin YhaK (pirin superfamily)